MYLVYVFFSADKMVFLPVFVSAGHMVPQHKPRVTFEFLSKWLKDEPWQGVNTYYTGIDDDIVGDESSASIRTS